MFSAFSDAERRMIEKYGRDLAESGNEFVNPYSVNETDTFQRKCLMWKAVAIAEKAYLTRKSRLERMRNAAS